MAVILILVATGVLAIVALFGSSSAVERSTKTTTHLASIESALEQFAAASSRLPCPANPTLDTGDELRNALDPATCAIPTGSVPWRTIGMRREDSLDAWGWKISYRVYTGGAGSLTQDGGASMVDCDANEALPAVPKLTPLAGSAGGLCWPQPAQNSRAEDFLTGKGLSVNDFGVAVTDAAYVLISHGPSGLGAFTSSGQQKPIPAIGDELTNMINVNPAVAYVVKAASPAGTAPEIAAHFDDVLAYRKLPDFVKRANLTARNWPDAVLGSVRFDGPTMNVAAGGPVAYGDVGRPTLNFYNANVTAFNAGGDQNLTFVQSGGIEGIGGLDGATSLSTNEGIRIELTQTPKAGKFAVTLNHFGTIFFGIWIEQAEFKFFDGATLRSTVLKPGCRADGGLASFTIDAGGEFDKVEIRPLATTNAFGFGNFPSSFFVSEIRACLAGAACETSLQNAGNTCP